MSKLGSNQSSWDSIDLTGTVESERTRDLFRSDDRIDVLETRLRRSVEVVSFDPVYLPDVMSRGVSVPRCARSDAGVFERVVVKNLCSSLALTYSVPLSVAHEQLLLEGHAFQEGRYGLLVLEAGLKLTGPKTTAVRLYYRFSKATLTVTRPKSSNDILQEVESGRSIPELSRNLLHEMYDDINVRREFRNQPPLARFVEQPRDWSQSFYMSRMNVAPDGALKE